MKIIEYLWRNRRDFEAKIKCENCGATRTLSRGYDDRNYHDNVIPSIRCESCGKSRKDLGIEQPPTATRYESWEVV